MRGLRANYSELELLMTTFRPAAFCLQELLISDFYVFQNRQYTFLKKLPDTDSNTRPNGGAGILIRKDIAYSAVTVKSPLQAVASRISLPQPVTLCSVYLPPTSSWNYTDLLSLVSSLPSPVILMGDFNSHSTLWGCSSTNQKGLEMETFLLQSNLCLLNSKSPTYLHPATGSLSSLDLALCDPSLYLDFNWSVHNDLCGSDHYPIVISNAINEQVNNLTRWQLTKADWVLFNSLCSSDLTKSPLDQSSNTIENFTTKLLEIAHKTIPKTCGRLAIRKKPWFNNECKSAIINRKEGLGQLLANPTQSNLSNYKILKAKARRTIRKSKRDSWRSYISRITTKTPMKKVWDMIRRISGKTQQNVIHHLVSSNNKIEHPHEIANTIASSFSFNSSPENLTENFQRWRILQEKKPLTLNSDNSESYNIPFVINELLDSLHQAHDTAVGPDDIHYQMLKHLPEISQYALLDLFNNIWTSGCFPPSWSEATIVPIPKPDKDLTSPNNYRPISLTSCMCKTFERMVSNRLAWYLEVNNIFTELQNGFRKQRTTTDQLVRLESFIREAFIRKEHVVSVFFDLEKAYETTWQYGIMRDLRDAGLRGRLPIFISKFLANRQFRVRVGCSLSDLYKQEMGVPQGGVLSVLLFVLKINSIVKCLPAAVKGSLFVDDFFICYRY